MKTTIIFIASSDKIKTRRKFNHIKQGEILNRDTMGVNYVTDVTDPWTGEQDIEWRSTIPSSTDIRGVNNINYWLNTFVTPASTQVYNWGTDIFGNNYALLKNIQNIDPYNQQFIGGCIWVRTIDNELKSGMICLNSYSDTRL